MIFLIDENLTPQLAGFHSKPHSGIHINQLKPHHKAVIKDDFIRKLSLDHPFVLVTKDDDFVKSWVSRKVPEKVIYVFDNFPNIDHLKTAYQKEIPSLEKLILKTDFIEFSNQGIRMPIDEPLPYRSDPQ